MPPRFNNAAWRLAAEVACAAAFAATLRTLLNWEESRARACLLWAQGVMVEAADQLVERGQFKREALADIEQLTTLEEVEQ